MSEKNLCSRAISYLKYLYFDHLVPFIYPYILNIRSRLTGDKIIHVVGDSHTQAFRYIYPFVVHHLGASTAYNLNSINSTTNSSKQLAEIAGSINKDTEALLLVFGEIDCRIHIYNQYRKSNKKVPVNDLIKSTVNRYGVAMAKLKKKNIRFYVLSVAPAGNQGNIYNYKYYGSYKERSNIHNLFNQELQKFCIKHDYAYIDLYSQIVDKTGGIKSEYLLDELHINEKSVAIAKKLMAGVII